MSQQSSKEAKIDGDTYEVFHLDADTGWKYCLKFDRIVAPVIGKLAEASAKNGVDSEAPLADMAQTIVDGLTEEVLQDLTKDLEKVTHVNGKELARVSAAHFRGKLGSKHKWFVFALRANFEDFFKSLAGDLSHLGDALK